MLRSDSRELYRESIGTKAFLIGGVAGAIVYLGVLALMVFHWERENSLPFIMAIYFALPFGLSAFAVVFPLAACWFGIQEFRRRRRESHDNI